MNTTTPIHTEHQLILVIFSVLVAISSSYTAFQLVSRSLFMEKGFKRNYWLSAAAISLGSGIWAMHFIGMLALEIPLAVQYNPFFVFLSMIFPIATSFAAFYLLFSSPFRKQPILSGIIMGTGIILMHYIGVEAMIVQAAIQYHPLWVTVSMLVALLSAIVSMQLFALFKDNPVYNKLWTKAAAAALLGIAISGMHYTGMKATAFLTIPGYRQHVLKDWPENNSLALSIGCIIFFIQLFIFSPKTSIKKIP